MSHSSVRLIEDEEWVLVGKEKAMDTFTVRTSTKNVIEVSGDLSLPVASLHAAIEEITGLKCSEQALVNKGTRLKDSSRPINSYGVKQGSRVMLVGKPRRNLKGEGVGGRVRVKLKQPPPPPKRHEDQGGEMMGVPGHSFPPPPQADEGEEALVLWFKGCVQELQKGLGRPSSSTPHKDLLDRGSLALDGMSSVAENGLRAFKVLNSEKEGGGDGVLSEFSRMTDVFVTQIQTQYFDSVLSDDAELVARRRACNKRANQLVSLFDT